MTAKCIDTRRRSAPATLRSCLCCRQDFTSAGPHERICQPCKESEEWVVGAAEFQLAPGEARKSGE